MTISLCLVLRLTSFKAGASVLNHSVVTLDNVLRCSSGSSNGAVGLGRKNGGEDAPTPDVIVSSIASSLPGCSCGSSARTFDLIFNI